MINSAILSALGLIASPTIIIRKSAWRIDSFTFSTDKLEQIVQDAGIIEANEISDQIKKEIGIIEYDAEDFGRKIVSIETTAKYHEEDFMDIERKFADAFDIMDSLF